MPKIKSKLSRDSYVDNIVFVSGITRSGKALLLPLVASLNNSEKVSVNFFLELITAMHSTNEISDELAIYLLRSGMNMMAYDNAIGRNANFRKDDYTSIWKYKEPLEYITRLIEDDGDRVFEKIDKEKKIFPVMWHNGLWHAEIIFKAFPTAKILHMQRNPIDIVYSWISRGYDGDFLLNKRSSDSLVYKHNNEIIPHYAHGWEDEYCLLNGVDKIIHVINSIRKYHIDSYDKLSDKNKKQVMLVKFKELVLDPEPSMASVASFLNTTVSKYTQEILIKERCPRILDPKEVEKKLSAIEELATAESIDLLKSMVYDFNHSAITI